MVVQAERGRSAHKLARAHARVAALRRSVGRGAPPPVRSRSRLVCEWEREDRRMEGAPVRIRTEARAERLLAVHAIPEQSVVGFAESASKHIHIELTNSVSRIRMQMCKYSDEDA